MVIKIKACIKEAEIKSTKALIDGSVQEIVKKWQDFTEAVMYYVGPAES